MADDKTIIDPDATVAEDGKTKYESDATVCEQDATACEGKADTVPDKGAPAPSGASSPSDGATFEKGSTILDTYRVESNPIHGGMGSVWRVHHTGWNTDLAMKRPLAKCFATEKSKADFIDECQSWINLGLHPNIVSCYYVREIAGVPSIFSEWMDGGSLESAIQKETLYTGTEIEQQERILDIAIQFARGLHYAHEAGLIHQDVKPDNLLLTREGEAKVADFGLAKARVVLTALEGDLPGVNGQADGGKTILSPSGGYTPAYCSMEQMDGMELTRRTDIYSWAVSVMEMFVGGRDWANGVVAGLSCEGYLAETRVPVSAEMCALLSACMAAKPDDRPHDFAEIENGLQEIYRAETGSDYPRPAPKAAADTADSLNNRALSMLDLGKPENAEYYWQLALHANAQNPAANYNYWLRRWESAQCTNADASARLREAKLPEELLTRFTERYRSPLLLSVEHASKTGFGWPVVSDDGQFFAYSRIETDKRHVIDMRRVDTGALVGTMQGHAGPVTQISFLPGNATRLVSCGADDALRLWDASTSACLLTHFELPEKIETRQVRQRDGSLVETRVAVDQNTFDAFVPLADGQRVLTVSRNKGLALWPLDANGKKTVLNPAMRGTALALCPDEQQVFVAQGQRILRSRLSDGKSASLYSPMFVDRHAAFQQVFVTRDGRRVITSGENIPVLSADTGEVLCQMSPWGARIAVSWDGQLLISWGRENATLWRTADGALLHVFPETMTVFMSAFAPDGRILLFCEDGSIRIYGAVEPRQKMDWIISRIETAGERFQQEARFFALLTEAENALVGIETAYEADWAAVREDRVPEKPQTGDAVRTFEKIFNLLEEAGQIPGMEYDDRLLTLRERVGKYCRVRSVRSVQFPITYRLFAPGWHRWETIADPNREHLLAQDFLPDGRLMLIYADGIRILNPDTVLVESMEPLIKSADYGWRVYENEETRRWLNVPKARRIPKDGVMAWDDYAYWRGEDRPGTVFGVARVATKVYEEATEKRICSYLFGDGLEAKRTAKGTVLPDGGGGVYRVRTMVDVSRSPVDSSPAYFRYVLFRQSLFDGSMQELGTLWNTPQAEYAPDRVSCLAVTPGEHIAAAIIGTKLVAANFLKEQCFQVNGVDPIHLLSNGFVLCGNDPYDRRLKILDPHSGDSRVISVGVPAANDRLTFRHLSASRNGTRAAAVLDDREYILRIIYDYDFPGWSDDTAEAEPYFQVFLARAPEWKEADFRELVGTLQGAGLGYLLPSAVLSRLKALRKASPAQGMALLPYLRSRHPNGESENKIYLDRPASGPDSAAAEQEHRAAQARATAQILSKIPDSAPQKPTPPVQKPTPQKPVPAPPVLKQEKNPRGLFSRLFDGEKNNQRAFLFYCKLKPRTSDDVDGTALIEMARIGATMRQLGCTAPPKNILIFTLDWNETAYSGTAVRGVEANDLVGKIKAAVTAKGFTYRGEPIKTFGFTPGTPLGKAGIFVAWYQTEK